MSSVIFQDKRQELKDKVKQLQERWATCVTEQNNIDVHQELNCIHNELQFYFSYLMDELDYIYSRFLEHERGHLPPFKTPSQLENALEKLGMGDDYEVYRPMITSASTNGQIDVKIDYEKKSE